MTCGNIFNTNIPKYIYLCKLESKLNVKRYANIDIFRIDTKTAKQINILVKFILNLLES